MGRGTDLAILGSAAGLAALTFAATRPMAAENCNIREGDTVAIWGAGPVGQFAIKSALMLWAGQVVSIDHYEDRLELARQQSNKVKTINFDEEEVYDRLLDLTGWTRAGLVH